MLLFAPLRPRTAVRLVLGLLGVLSFPVQAFAWTVMAPAGVELHAVASDRGGGVLAAGTRMESGSRSVYVTKRAADGALLWETPAGMISGDVQAVATIAGGDVIAVGSELRDQDRSVALATRFDGANGRILWRATVSPPNVGAVILEGSADVVEVGARGEVIVGGYVRTEHGASALVARLDPEDGNGLWNWSASSTTVTDLAIDRRGNVLATGSFFLAVKLRGTDGAPQWRVNTPGAGLQERGYPQMRSLALDAKGNVTVGGSLRNVLEDTRSFYVTRLATASGRRLSETAGPALYSFESSVRVLSLGAAAYTAGRLNGDPAVLRCRAGGGPAKWSQRPWGLDDAPDGATGVADLASDRAGVYALGTDFSGRLLVTAFNSNGKARWTRDLGVGSGLRMSVAGRRLFIVGTLQSDDGLRSVLVELETKSGSAVD